MDSRVVLVCLAGCKAAASPAAECRERQSHRYDPGVLTIAEKDPLIVRTVRCKGAFDDRAVDCSDDAPTALRFTVTAQQAPPRCSSWDLRSDCWWENRPTSTHGDSPGSTDATGTFSFSRTADASGGATNVVVKVGVAQQSTLVRVRLVLVENPGHIESDLVERLGGAHGAVPLRFTQTSDGSTWRTDQGDREPIRLPVLDLEGHIGAARVHIENASGSITYDGYFARSPITLSRTSWTAITRSTEQEEALVVRVTALSGADVATAPEQTWHVDHGIFYHSPATRAAEEEEEQSRSAGHAAREREWIQTHAYIPREEAIALAVRFLADQGYTDAPAAAAPIKRDFVESGSEAEIRAYRRGSMDATPVGTKKKAGFWWIAFRYAHAKDGDACHVRVVAVSADGSRRRMIHQDASLASFD